MILIPVPPLVSTKINIIWTLYSTALLIEFDSFYLPCATLGSIFWIYQSIYYNEVSGLGLKKPLINWNFIIVNWVINSKNTCGSLDQQSVKRMLHDWLVRAWRPAPTKHSRFPAEALPKLAPLISFQCLSFPSMVSSQTFPRHFPCSKPTMWPVTEQRRPTLTPLPVILLPIQGLVKQLITFYTICTFSCKCAMHFGGHVDQSIVYVQLFKLKVKMNQNSFLRNISLAYHTRTLIITAANLQGWVKWNIC